MTLAKASELLAVQAGLKSGYNRNAAKPILAEAEHGQAAVDQFIREFNLEQVFGFAPGTGFS